MTNQELVSAISSRLNRFASRDKEFFATQFRFDKDFHKIFIIAVKQHVSIAEAKHLDALDSIQHVGKWITSAAPFYIVNELLAWAEAPNHYDAAKKALCNGLLINQITENEKEALKCYCRHQMKIHLNRFQLHPFKNCPEEMH